MRVAVTGGRDFKDAAYVARVLDHVHAQVRIAPLIEGEARGVDTLAREWAQSRGVPFTPFPADWVKHPRSAGPLRNRDMLREGKPELLIAFPGGRGTADMISICRVAGVPVVCTWEHSY